jgi:hypothetical protein
MHARKPCCAMQIQIHDLIASYSGDGTPPPRTLPGPVRTSATSWWLASNQSWVAARVTSLTGRISLKYAPSQLFQTRLEGPGVA